MHDIDAHRRRGVRFRITDRPNPQLEFFPLEGNASTFFSGAAGGAFRERVRRPAEFRRLFDNYLSLFLEKFLKGAWDACQGADVVLSWSRCATAVAERLRVPVFVVALNPVLHLPTFAFPNPFQGPSHLRLGPIFNRLSWRLALPATRIGEAQGESLASADAWIGRPRLAQGLASLAAPAASARLQRVGLAASARLGKVGARDRLSIAQDDGCQVVCDQDRSGEACHRRLDSRMRIVVPGANLRMKTSAAAMGGSALSPANVHRSRRRANAVPGYNP